MKGINEAVSPFPVCKDVEHWDEVLLFGKCIELGRMMHHLEQRPETEGAEYAEFQFDLLQRETYLNEGRREERKQALEITNAFIFEAREDCDACPHNAGKLGKLFVRVTEPRNEHSISTRAYPADVPSRRITL